MKRVLFSLCFGLALGLVAAEIVVRVYNRLTADSPSWSDRPRFYFQSADANTLQDYRYDEKKGVGVFRIAVVGDSYTFAPYMQFTDTFPKKLEIMLNLNAHGRRVEVINFGVPAYSASHEVAVVKKALQMESDLVLMQVTLNDPEVKPYRPTGINENVRDRFGELRPRGWQKRLFRYWKTAELVARRLHNTRTHKAYADYFNSLFKKRKTWGSFRDSWRRLVRIARESNTPIVAVVFPLFGLPLDRNYPFRAIHEKVAEFMSKLSVPHLDLYDRYAGIPLERLQVVPGQDRHPNEIAHRMAAEYIYLWLARSKLLPAELRIPRAYHRRLGIVSQPPFLDSAFED